MKFINYIFYTMFLGGLLILMSERLNLMLRRFRLRHRLSSAAEEKDILEPATAALGRLASVSLGRDINGFAMLWSLVFLFLVIFFLALNSFTAATAMLVAMISALSPVLLMYIKLMGEQGKSSREGIAFVSEIFRQYRVCGANMSEALEKTIENSKNFPLCARHSYRLLLHLRAASGSR